MMSVPNCPRCGTPAIDPPKQEWNFGKYHVSRFECDCGDKYNFYTGGKNGGFTIPRPFVVATGFCMNCKTKNPEEAVFCKNCGTKLVKEQNH